MEQDILNSFRKNGFELISPRFNHMRNFLTCLPFMAGKGLFKQLKEAGVVQRAESFNVANLMPLVQQQGRNGQLRISFGSAKHPDCRGITVDELQKIQFNRLDFTNFYEDLMNNQKIPDSGVLTQKVKEQIADQLKQAGQ
ncbi:TPA: conjugal transfer protein TraN [Escherichia coli]|nr:hypothetical protein [Escherichia coli]HAM3662731.1 conjugal transfer protein TraN [Escherichia coli]